MRLLSLALMIALGCRAGPDAVRPRLWEPPSNSTLAILLSWAESSATSANLPLLRSAPLPRDREELRVWYLGGLTLPEALILVRRPGRFRSARLVPDQHGAFRLLPLRADAAPAWDLVDSAPLSRFLSDPRTLPDLRRPPTDSSRGSVTIACNDCVEIVVEWRRGEAYDVFHSAAARRDVSAADYWLALFLDSLAVRAVTDP
jgi:hypothetical protein